MSSEITRVRIARWLWVAYAPLYVFLFVGGLLGSLALPYLVSLPLGPLSLLTLALVPRPLRPRAVGWLLVGLGNLILGVLILNGASDAGGVGPRVGGRPVGLPEALWLPGVVLGALLPLALLADTLRRLRPRHLAPEVSAKDATGAAVI